MRVNYFKIKKNEPRITKLLEALKTVENTVITPSINFFLIKTNCFELGMEMIRISKEDYYHLIDPFDTKSFYDVESKNGHYKIWVSRPNGEKSIITTSFNIYDYTGFLKALMSIDFIQIVNTHKADNFCSVEIQLLQKGSLNKLMEELADLLFDYVEKEELQGLHS